MRTGSRFLSVLSVVLLVALALGACGGSDKSSSDEKSTATQPRVTAQLGGVSAVVRGEGQAKDATEMEIDDNYFKPNILHGTAGQAVTLQLSSEGKSLHNFSLAEQNISKDITAGSKLSVKVTFPASGDLAFFCKYHKAESGMVGVLRVGP